MRYHEEMKRKGAIHSICLLAAICGCSDVETALQLRLTSDATLNTEQQVLAGVDTLVLVLDAPAGFSGAGSAGQTHGELTASDPDNDGQLELVLQRDLHGAMPLLRLLPGSNADVSFKITARGQQRNQTTAVGGVAAAAFTVGQVPMTAMRSDLRNLRNCPKLCFLGSDHLLCLLCFDHDCCPLGGWQGRLPTGNLDAWDCGSTTCRS